MRRALVHSSVGAHMDGLKVTKPIFYLGKLYCMQARRKVPVAAYLDEGFRLDGSVSNEQNDAPVAVYHYSPDKHFLNILS